MVVITEIKTKLLTESPDKISCLVGNSTIVFIIYKDLSVKSIVLSLKKAEEIMSQFYFERINYHAVVNTKHLSRIGNQRIIELKNGIQFRVSRKKWHLFNCIK